MNDNKRLKLKVSLIWSGIRELDTLQSEFPFPNPNQHLLKAVRPYSYYQTILIPDPLVPIFIWSVNNKLQYSFPQVWFDKTSFRICLKMPSILSRGYLLISGTILSFNNRSDLPEGTDFKQNSPCPSIFSFPFSKKQDLPPLQILHEGIKGLLKSNRWSSSVQQTLEAQNFNTKTA